MHGWIDKCLSFCNYFLTRVAGYQNLVLIILYFFRMSRGRRHYWCRRSNVFGLLGIMLQAFERQWDLQKFIIVSVKTNLIGNSNGKKGDSLSHYLVQIGEIIPSIKVIQRALGGILGEP